MSDVTVDGPFRNRIESSISPMLPKTKGKEDAADEWMMVMTMM